MADQDKTSTVSATVQKKESYFDLALEADKPLAKRAAVATGRGGRRMIPRCYHLSVTEYTELKAKEKETGQFQSPFRANGNYNAIVMALIALGENKTHPVAEVFKKFKEVLSCPKTADASGKTAWERFEKKKPRNQETGRSALGRFLQNCTVLQRLGGKDPYGLPLAQLGASVDIMEIPVEHDGKTHKIAGLRLRTGITDFVSPVNESKKRKYHKSVEGVRPGPLNFPGSRPPDAA